MKTSRIIQQLIATLTCVIVISSCCADEIVFDFNDNKIKRTDERCINRFTIDIYEEHVVFLFEKLPNSPNVYALDLSQPLTNFEITSLGIKRDESTYIKHKRLNLVTNKEFIVEDRTFPDAHSNILVLVFDSLGKPIEHKCKNLYPNDPEYKLYH